MKKIMLITFYDPIEYFASIKENLEKFDYTVCHYPLFRYAYDQHDKKKEYAKHFAENIEEENPDIILWCFIDVPSDIFTTIKKKFPNTIFVLFNFDEPMNVSTELFKKANTCDIIMTTSKEYIDDYQKHTECKEIIYNPFGCDPKFYHELKSIDNNFECDIGMICYNLLYDTNFFNSQFINRKNMIENIVEYCKKNNKVFKIFGSHVIGEFFPDNFCGDISYINKNKLYNFSKIFICTQSFSDKSYYLDENIFSILCSGGLLMTDNTKDVSNILCNKKDCVFIDKNYYIRQIDFILNNYDKYKPIRANAQITAQSYTWTEWVKKLHKSITKITFNQSLYSELHNIPFENATYDTWVNTDIKQIASTFKIPINFNETDYANKYGFTKKTREFLYYHWFKNDKSNIFFKNNLTNSASNFDPVKNGMTVDKFMILGQCFNDMKYNCDGNLDKICELTEQHPNCNINELLKNYLELSTE